MRQSWWPAWGVNLVCNRASYYTIHDLCGIAYMTASVVAQMRFVACGPALRDRGWVQSSAGTISVGTANAGMQCVIEDGRNTHPPFGYIPAVTRFPVAMALRTEI